MSLWRMENIRASEAMYLEMEPKNNYGFITSENTNKKFICEVD